MGMYEYGLDEQVALLTLNESKFNMDSLTAFLSVLNKIEKETDAKALVVRSSDEKMAWTLSGYCHLSRKAKEVSQMSSRQS
jgi:hypothetical protein